MNSSAGSSEPIRFPGSATPPRGTEWDDPELDRELVEGARAGDEDALRGLVRRAHPLVHRWALVRTGDPSEADDLAQEALIRLVRGIGAFRGEARFSTWLYRVVHNTAVDRDRRRRRRRTREAPLEAAAEVAAAEEDPVETTARQRLMARVRVAFLALPERQREVFELADLQGLTSPEIAKRLEISDSTVRVCLLKARRSIRRRLLESDPELLDGMLP